MELKFTNTTMYSHDARADVLSLLYASFEVQDVGLGVLAELGRDIGKRISERVACRIPLREDARM